MGIEFTRDQQKVIDKRNANVLVSAAAGSGKTAVLVARILKLILDTENPTDIDRLLVVTFTNAAAAEMRERIGAALLAQLERDPENEHLQKQMTLIHNAQITTIDSFCLNVVKNNFNDIGIDPGFRVADQGEIELMKRDVLSAVLEEWFEKKDERFYRLAESFSSGIGEKALEDNILKLYNFSMSCPFPEKWLKKCRKEYCPDDLEELKGMEWMIGAMKLCIRIAFECSQQLQEGIEICKSPDGPYMYLPVLEAEAGKLADLAGESDYEKYYQIIKEFSFGRLPSKKDAAVSPVKREMVKGVRNRVKDSLEHLKEAYFAVSPKQAFEDIRASSGNVEILVDLTLHFTAELDAEKRDKNVIDFSDMEHFALKILLEEEEEGGLRPSKTAVSYRESFAEILIDEYQDSNLVQEYLLKSIAKESTECNNRFMVGDVKQSIYKFRLARPEIFMEKFKEYTLEDSANQRIDLKQNFRSRTEVIESVNYIFGQIMVKSLGGIEYDENAALYPGASYPVNGQGQETELLLVEKNKIADDIEEDSKTKNDRFPSKDTKIDSKLNKQEMEALAISAKIKDLKAGFKVTDKESGELRGIEYRDIVILLRSSVGWDETFRKVLMKEGIPVHVTSKTGYFSSAEIQVILNMLRILDNPRQDIPLCSVLLSPVTGFTQEELSCIRAEAGKAVCLYEALQNGRSRQDETGGRIENFIKQLEAFRKRIPYTPIHELLSQVMTETGFYSYMSAMPGGEQRKANMDMLFQKAVDFEKTSYHGLFYFIRYIEQMEKYDVDYGEANVLDEKADVVRIISIHKSKGLEFPVCFVSGMDKRFNMQDMGKLLIMDMDYGLGCDYFNPEQRYKAGTLRKSVIAEKMKLESIGEELRVLYVALTRAREKLIITGVTENLSKKLAVFSDLSEKRSEKLSFSFLSSLNSYLDFILAALIRHRCFAPFLIEMGMEPNSLNPFFQRGPDMTVRIFGAKELVERKTGELLQKEYLKKKFENNSNAGNVNLQLYSLIDERFHFVYPHTALNGLYTKTTVSELKKLGVSHEEAGNVLFPDKEPVQYIPKFIRQKEEITGAARGSAYHKVLELLDLNSADSEENIKGQLLRLVSGGRLSEEYYRAVRTEKLVCFAKSSLAGRMALAGRTGCLYREQPFVLGVPASAVNQEFPEEETILVQGIIDVYFEEEDGLVVADYKTDRVLSGEELWERYKTQLDYYADALERITGREVKEKIIYSFALDRELSRKR